VTRPGELRELPEAELHARLDTAKEELFNLRFQLATGQLDNPMRIKEVRREVARILTVITERELAGASEGAGEPAPVTAEESQES
jgi:large subunit ribosomal protein L29